MNPVNVFNLTLCKVLHCTHKNSCLYTCIHNRLESEYKEEYAFFGFENGWYQLLYLLYPSILQQVLWLYSSLGFHNIPLYVCTRYLLPIFTLIGNYIVTFPYSSELSSNKCGNTNISIVGMAFSMPENKMLGSYDSSINNFLKDLQTNFYYGHNNFDYHQ